MERTFTATIEKRDKWDISWVDEVPGAFSQGKTIKEVQENLKKAVQLILESQRELFGEAPLFFADERYLVYHVADGCQ